ncbi:energy-coupling factor transporter transmembrane component T family protein [Acidianus infernus]|uniref:energy-coupling factor transporter transmembrane component T family protein n=1 Tax=Acidianus infernus TaxID=12915 RepID=UPI00359411CB
MICIQYLLLPLVYFVTIFLMIKLGYGGLAEIVKYEKRKVVINPISKIIFEIGLFVFLTRGFYTIFSLNNVELLFAFPLLLLSAIFLVLRNKIKCLAYYVGAYLLITAWVEINSFYGYGSTIYTWSCEIARIFGYSTIVTYSSLFHGILFSLYSPTLYITLLGFVFISTTNTSEVIRAFSELRIPLAITLIFSVFVKVIPQALRNMETSYKMTILRGLGYGKPFPIRLFYQLYGLMIVILPVFVYIAKGSRNLAIALETRGYMSKKNRTSLVKIGFHLIDYLLLFISIILFYISFS